LKLKSNMPVLVLVPITCIYIGVYYNPNQGGSS